MLACLCLAISLLSVPPAFEKSPDGAALDGQVVASPAAARQQIIAIVPDRTTGKDWGLRYLREAVDDFNREQPDAVFCVGDLVQGYSLDHADVIRERTEFLDIVGKLTMPFYPTAGNHDVVSGSRNSKDASFAEQYRNMFGPLYYAVELELASIVILNTEDGDGLVQQGFSDTQLQWLDTTLGRLNARNRPIMLLFHRPLWDHAPTKWDTRVQPMLVKHGVDYVIAGHYHSLQWLPPRDGIPFLILGTCGGLNDQHPLAGHVQHVTFVVINEDGTIEPYHQIAGCTLPVDWVTKADQGTAYGIKGSRDAVVIRGAVADPLGKPCDSTIEVVLKNPLNQPVDFELRACTTPVPMSVVDRDAGGVIERVWTSRTQIDIANPATTDFNTPFTLELPTEVFTLAAKASKTVVVRVHAQTQLLPPQPAPFEVIATFTDSKSRRVPITLRQRVPIARAVTLAPSIEAATAFPIAVWTWSEYDTREENAKVRIAAASALNGAASAMEISIDVPDQEFMGDANPSNAKSSLNDPLGDAVRLIFGEGAEAREYVITFDGETSAPVVRILTPDGSRLEATSAIGATFAKTSAAWHLSLIVAQSALPDGSTADGLRINIGVADNDNTYHTQWRWLAPRDLPVVLQQG